MTAALHVQQHAIGAQSAAECESGEGIPWHWEQYCPTKRAPRDVRLGSWAGAMPRVITVVSVAARGARGDAARQATLRSTLPVNMKKREFPASLMSPSLHRRIACAP